LGAKKIRAIENSTYRPSIYRGFTVILSSEFRRFYFLF